MKSPGLELFIITYNNAHESNGLDKKNELKVKQNQNKEILIEHTHTPILMHQRKNCVLCPW